MHIRCKFCHINAYVIIIVGLLLVGCEDPTQIAATEPTLSSLWTNVFADTCSLNCHMPGGTEESGPDMSTKALFFTNVVNKSSNNYPNWDTTVSSATCKNLKFINPTDVYSSTLVAGLILSYSQTFESTYMSTPCLSSYNVHLTNNVVITDSEKETALVNWINAGALNN